MFLPFAFYFCLALSCQRATSKHLHHSIKSHRCKDILFVQHDGWRPGHEVPTDKPRMHEQVNTKIVIDLTYEVSRPGKIIRAFVAKFLSSGRNRAIM